MEHSRRGECGCGREELNLQGETGKDENKKGG